MRPRALELQGFSAFRERTVVDFSDVGLLALIGPTGSGKSSLIDAMTFALYGVVPRYGERDVAPMINQLSNEARVRFEFEIDGVAYSATRVVRRTRSGANTREARLQVGDEVIAGDARSVTDHVIALLGLDFERFNKTVVLPQGRFQEFLHDKPRERQELLRELLGFGFYERIAQEARARAAMASESAARLEASVAASDATPERLQETKRRQSAVATLVGRASEAVEQISVLQADLRLEDRELDELRRRGQLVASIQVPDGVDELADEVATATDAVKTAETAHERARDAVRNAADALAAAPSVSECDRLLGLHARHEETAARLARARSALANAQEHADVKAAAAARVRSAIEEARTALADARRLRDEAEAAATDAGDPAALRSLLELHARAASDAESLDQVRREHLEAVGIVRDTTEARDRARAELAHLERQAPAAMLASGLQPGEPCPVCEQVVHELPTVHLVAEEDLRRAQEELGRATNAAESAARREAGLATQVDTVDRRWRDAVAQLANTPDLDVLEERLAEISTLRLRLDGANDAVRSAEQALNVAETSPAAEDALAAESQARADLAAAGAVVAQEEEQLSSAVADLDGVPAEDVLRAQLATAQLLAGAHVEAVRAEEEAERARREAAKMREAVAERERVARRAYHDARDSVATLKPPRSTDSLASDWSILVEFCARTSVAIQAEVARREEERDQLVARSKGVEDTLRAAVTGVVPIENRSAADIRDALIAEEAATRHTVDELQRELKRVEKVRDEVASLRDQAEVAALLGQVLKNDRFQRWLLEEAMDDLVDRANLRLHELTANQYSLVAHEGQFRVVDHANADEERDSRSLSGGETFLTSLSLALALADSSMDMAVEGTTRLDSIFLDEGFGTLDPDTLDIVAGTIEELGATGRMVGIVTHIRELAERMPTRLEVTKTAAGSTVTRVDV